MRLNTTLAGTALCLLLLASSAAASDCTLEIFGNANEDETINMQDVTYTELIILEYRDKTELADGKHDGKINMQDVTQIELVILGRELELTILDRAGEAVTISKPVERVVILTHNSLIAESLRALGVTDKVVGVSMNFQPGGYAHPEIFFPELSKVPNCGHYSDEPDYETILTLNPDVIHADIREWTSGEKEKVPGITVIYMDAQFQDAANSLRKLGYIYDKRDEAEEYINWRSGWIDEINARTEGLTDDDKPRVLLPGYYWQEIYRDAPYAGGSPQHPLILAAGGINLGVELGDMWCADADPEWVIEQNPDIFNIQSWGVGGYGVDDTSLMAEVVEDFVSSHPEFANTNAVKNGRVTIWDTQSIAYGGASGLIGTVYYAKMFHPELFDDLDPQAIHQEYLTEYQGLNYDLSEHGVFVYPPLVES